MYPHSPRLWLNIRAGASQSACASASARPGSPGRSARSASGAVGWTWTDVVATAPEDTASRIGSRARWPRRTTSAKPSRADAVRGAAVQAFQATAGQAGVTRERAQELADELAQAAGRFMGALDELRPASADEIRSLREDLRALETPRRRARGRRDDRARGSRQARGRGPQGARGAEGAGEEAGRRARSRRTSS